MSKSRSESCQDFSRLNEEDQTEDSDSGGKYKKHSRFCEKLVIPEESRLWPHFVSGEDPPNPGKDAVFGSVGLEMMMVGK